MMLLGCANHYLGSVKKFCVSKNPQDNGFHAAKYILDTEVCDCSTRFTCVLHLRKSGHDSSMAMQVLQRANHFMQAARLHETLVALATQGQTIPHYTSPLHCD